MRGAPDRCGAKVAALAWVFAAALALAGAAARADDESEVPHHHHHHESAEPGHGVARSEQAYAVPEVQLKDTDGRPVAARSALESDEPVMLDFIYTSCSAVCPMLSEIFAQVQRQLGADAAKLRMVSISIDPDYDTPKVLGRYAQTYHAGPQWRFLTGTTQDVSAVQQAFDAWKANKMDHAPLVFLRASKHSPWIRFEGLVDPGTLVRELRAMNG
jgi:protein SCO1